MINLVLTTEELKKTVSFLKELERVYLSWDYTERLAEKIYQLKNITSKLERRLLSE